MEVFSKKELIYRIKRMPSQRDQALAAFIYLTGARISEILGTMKIIKRKDGTRKILKVRPLSKESVELKKEDGLIVVNNVPCLKRRKKLPKRNIPIVIHIERKLVEIFWVYYRTLSPGEPLFKITRQRAWQILKKGMGIYGHYLIHERCTDLVKEHSFSDSYLKQFRGWADTRMAATYTHLEYRDLARKMKN